MALASQFIYSSCVWYWFPSVFSSINHYIPQILYRFLGTPLQTAATTSEFLRHLSSHAFHILPQLLLFSSWPISLHISSSTPVVCSMTFVAAVPFPFIPFMPDTLFYESVSSWCSLTTPSSYWIKSWLSPPFPRRHTIKYVCIKWDEKYDLCKLYRQISSLHSHNNYDPWQRCQHILCKCPISQMFWNT